MSLSQLSIYFLKKKPSSTPFCRIKISMLFEMDLPYCSRIQLDHLDWTLSLNLRQMKYNHQIIIFITVTIRIDSYSITVNIYLSLNSASLNFLQDYRSALRKVLLRRRTNANWEFSEIPPVILGRYVTVRCFTASTLIDTNYSYMDLKK